MGTSLVAQEIRIYLPSQGTWTGSIPGAGRFHAPQPPSPRAATSEARVPNAWRRREEQPQGEACTP